MVKRKKLLVVWNRSPLTILPASPQTHPPARHGEHFLNEMSKGGEAGRKPADKAVLPPTGGNAVNFTRGNTDLHQGDHKKRKGR